MSFHRKFILVSLLAIAGCSSSSSASSANDQDAGSASDASAADNADAGKGSSSSKDAGAPIVDAGDTVLDGDPAHPKTCADICAAAGLTCDPNYEWPNYINSDSPTNAFGGYAEYDSDDESSDNALDCADPPSPTGKVDPDGPPGTLSSYSCACR